MSTHNIGRGDSNEYPQHRFLWRNKQNYLLFITKYPHLIRPLSFFVPQIRMELTLLTGKTQYLIFVAKFYNHNTGIIVKTDERKQFI